MTSGAERPDDSTRGRRRPRIRAYLARHVTIGVAFPPLETAKGILDPFFNINTPDELALARSYLENLQS